MKILLFFFGFVLLEIALFAWVGGAIGVLGTLAWVVASAFLGFFIIRLRTTDFASKMRDVRNGLQSQVSMVPELVVFFAAFLIVLPGFFTDFLGVVLLISPNFLRAIQKRRFGDAAQRQQQQARRHAPGQTREHQRQSDIIETEYHEINDTNR